MGASSSRENEGAALEFIERTITEHPVVIFSKSYCPYCTLVRSLCITMCASNTLSILVPC